MELPTYPGAVTAFRASQAQLAGVAQDDDGIDLDDLERVWAREQSAGRRVAFLYVVPNFQNPTGLLISLEKRRRLVEWAARRDVIIVEDDPYGALYFEDVASESDTRPIAADPGDATVVYLSSFSKTVAPGFRVAWMAGPPPIIEKMELALQAAELCGGSLDQRVVYEVWKRGLFDARLPDLRRAYQERRTVMETALRSDLGTLVSWPEPRGGFFLWATLPESLDTLALLPKAIEAGVVYVAGTGFYVDGRATSQLRLSYSGSSLDVIRTGISRLASAVHAAL